MWLRQNTRNFTAFDAYARRERPEVNDSRKTWNEIKGNTQIPNAIKGTEGRKINKRWQSKSIEQL